MLKLFWKCFYDKASYVEVCKKKYNMFVFTIFLTLLIMIPRTIKFNLEVKDVIENSLVQVCDQLPEMKFYKGKMTLTDMEGPVPVVMFGKPFFIIDPEGSIYSDKSNFDELTNKIFIFGDGYMTVKANGEIKLQSYPDSEEFILNAEKARAFLAYYPVFSVFFYVFGSIGRYATILLWGLIFFAVALIVSNSMKLQFPKLNLFYMVLLTLVPAQIVETVIHSVKPGLDLWYIYLAMNTGYLLISLSHINRELKAYEEKKDMENKE